MTRPEPLNRGQLVRITEKAEGATRLLLKPLLALCDGRPEIALLALHHLQVTLAVNALRRPKDEMTLADWVEAVDVLAREYEHRVKEGLREAEEDARERAQSPYQQPPA